MNHPYSLTLLLFYSFTPLFLIYPLNFKLVTFN